jgi:RNA polymerase sigma-70 factor (ECF subfamily)
MMYAPPGRADLRYGPETERANSINVQELTDLMPYLHRFACSLTRDAEQAADLAQDTVERALRKSHLFDGANLRAWLTTICKRIFLNNLRRDKLRRFDVCIDDAPADRLYVPAEQDDQVHFADVAAALKRLPENHRLVISLCSVRGMKYLEVAERLGIPIGTVRSRLSRARLKLGSLVRGGEPPPAARAASIARSPRCAADETTHSA